MLAQAFREGRAGCIAGVERCLLGQGFEALLCGGRAITVEQQEAAHFVHIAVLTVGATGLGCQFLQSWGGRFDLVQQGLGRVEATCVHIGIHQPEMDVAGHWQAGATFGQCGFIERHGLNRAALPGERAGCSGKCVRRKVGAAGTQRVVKCNGIGIPAALEQRQQPIRLQPHACCAPAFGISRTSLRCCCLQLVQGIGLSVQNQVKFGKPGLANALIAHEYGPTKLLGQRLLSQCRQFQRGKSARMFAFGGFCLF
ncbi:hypothetical protein D9M73_88350 [compost metagenome]